MTTPAGRRSCSRDGKDFLTGRLTVIGSVSVARQTWLWSWANESLRRLGSCTPSRTTRSVRAGNIAV
ncbi:DUF6882 domain-containing protein [Streptomyces sp. NPDC002276]